MHLHRPGPRMLGFLTFIVLTLYYFRSVIHSTYIIIRLPVVWKNGSQEFVLSKEHDDFDITFANYSNSSDTAQPTYPDLVPPVIHHIALGASQLKQEWLDARQSCLEFHEGWESYLWTDANAAQFVEEHFPDFKATWEGYRHPIQKIDALRYMVLYEYGGVVLDMDLKCTRSLGPLRRFDFLAPAAHPTGFSVGFMMASKHHPFMRDLVRNLPIYNLRWFGLPYPTVMFSTGCHYASAIHTMQKDRASLKILGGAPENPNMHRLNGDAVTPLFHHLGTSSWHSFDAELIVMIGKPSRRLKAVYVMFAFSIVTLVLVKMRRRGSLGRYASLGRKLRGKVDGPLGHDGMTV